MLYAFVFARALGFRLLLAVGMLYGSLGTGCWAMPRDSLARWQLTAYTNLFHQLGLGATYRYQERWAACAQAKYVYPSGLLGYRSSGFAGLGPVLAGHGFELTGGALYWFHTRRTVTFEGAYRYTQHGPLLFTTGQKGAPPDAIYEEYAATYHTYLIRGYYTFLFPMRHTPYLQWRWGLVLGANLGLHWQQLDLRTRGTQANPETVNQEKDRFLLAMPLFLGLVLHWNQYREDNTFKPVKPSKFHWSYSKREKKKKPRRVLD